MRTLLTGLALLISHQGAAHAAEPIGRDLNGRTIALPSSAAPMVLVFWTLDCADCLAPVEELQAGGLDVVLVNTDGTAARSSLQPFLRRQGVDAPLLPDAAADIQQRFGVQGQGLVLLDASGAVTLRASGPRIDPAVALAAAGRETTSIARMDD